MISFHSLIGKEIIASVPSFDEIKWQKLKLVNVEPSGIWVENRKVCDLVMKESGITIAPKTAVFFVPFCQIKFVLASLDVPYISDEVMR
jgi:hypothetical protein